MKNDLFTRILCALLTTITAVPLLIGCSDSQADSPVESETTLDTFEESTTETQYHQEPLVLPVTDYNSATITIMSGLPDDAESRFAEFRYDKELAGEVVNDAVYARNVLVEELLNIHIANNDIAVTDIASTLNRQTLAGDTSIDVYTPYLATLQQLITRGCLLNLYDIPVLNINNPWWDQAINRDLAISEKVYIQAGDILFSSKEKHGALAVNKKLLTDNGLEIPYQTVLDGDWTLDVMYELCQDMTRDLNGDGELNHEDQFGYTHVAYSAYSLFTNAGGRILSLNSEGQIEFSKEMEHNVAILEKLTKIYSDPNIMYSIDDMPNTWTTNAEMFANDQVCMQPISIYNLQLKREMISDFGILPLPKYDETQDHYISVPSTFQMQAITIPITNTQLEATGATLEALAYHSASTTVKAYYDYNLQTKVSRDNESGLMLDIIFASTAYDIIETFHFGNIYDIVCNGISDPNKFVSSLTKNEKSTQKAIDKFYSYLIED